MPTPQANMATLTISLTADERDVLLGILERSLGEVKIEARHTDERSFRQKVIEERKVIESLLAKIR